ncbi:MAG: M1 family metallopeptidase [Bacteroidota bacterium]
MKFGLMFQKLTTTLAFALLLFAACTPKAARNGLGRPDRVTEPGVYDTIGKPVTGEDDIVYDFEEPAAINPDSLPPYNPAHTLEIDLIHEKVEISFDWTKRRANGRATLVMKPWFYSTDRVSLDAKNFDIDKVTFVGQGVSLKYDYDNEKLTVYLGRKYTRKDTFALEITYLAKPEERDEFGGSDAITSDKGLYFINADGSDPEKPRQIWTQGETESNSFWMPTVDKPNERCTQEMYITVDDKYKTLSNGLLISSVKNSDGTRTDYWKMDKPHAPYLFMMAVGEFAVVKDKWRGIDVDYYVEPKFEPQAREIYPNTVEMLEFFSGKLNYPYPWQKYSQVVVRDYVSGAMENTTAVIFGEFMQKSARELRFDSETNEKVVAHEMFHHWFGDLVTTENWANLTLNEGFANYSEYLWFEHKHGREAADNHLMNEQQGYIESAYGGGHPLIHYGYNSREDMFDAHSYNKGGCVLHMLRLQLGDEAFFEALNRYLINNKYTAVEVDELRMAFEEVTGQDLHWFFDQWFIGAGHPVLDISYGWEENVKKASVTIRQSQEGDKVTRVFNLPLAVDIYDAAGNAVRHNIRVVKREQTFYFDLPGKPALVNVDADKGLLCDKTDNHTPEEWAFMYRYAPLFRDRVEALTGLQNAESELTETVSKEALKDSSKVIRRMAIGALNPADPALLADIIRMAESDTDSDIRAACIDYLGRLKEPAYRPVFEKGLSPDLPNNVIGASLNGLAALDPAAAAKAGKILEQADTDDFVAILSDLYCLVPDTANLHFFESKFDKPDGYDAFSFFDNYKKLLLSINNTDILDAGVTRLSDVSKDMKQSVWRRFACTKAISDIRKKYDEEGDRQREARMKMIIREIMDSETDPMLKQYYAEF